MNATHNPEELLNRAETDGLTLRLDGGKLRYSAPREVAARWLPTLKEHKADLVREMALRMVRTMLDGGDKYAVAVPYASSDPVIVYCGIQGLATFELAIPHHSYDGMILLELLERHGQETTKGDKKGWG